MRTITILAMLLACTLLACSPTAGGVEPGEYLTATPPQTSSPPRLPPQTSSPPTTVTAPLVYFGEESIEERIARRDTIVRAVLSTTTTEIVTTTAEGWSGKYYVGLKFYLMVSEYLQGSGADSITVLTVQGDYDTRGSYNTRGEAEGAMLDIAAGRVATWDDCEAILFLSSDDPGDIFSASVQGANEYFLTIGLTIGVPDENQDMYSLHNRHSKLWLPSAGTTASGDSQEFLLAAPRQGTETPTVTLGELKRRITAVNARLRGSDGSDAYRECVARSYQSERMEHHRMSESGSGSLDPIWGGNFASGQSIGTEVYEYIRGWAEPAEQKSRLWLDGRDSDLFAVRLGDLRPGRDYDRDGQPDGFEFDQSIVTSRPIPTGTYEFNHHVIPWFLLACEHTFSFEMTVNVLASSGALHEFFFDPVTVGSAVVADASNGVLKPTSFTDTDGATATVESISYESPSTGSEPAPGSNRGRAGRVRVKVVPWGVMSGQVLDFIGLDGAVSLSLNVANSAVDDATDTLTWSVSSQPWEDGDMLMGRIRRAAP